MEKAEVDKGVLQEEHKASVEYDGVVVENVATKVSTQ